jgi:hypothetical protein
LRLLKYVQKFEIDGVPEECRTKLESDCRNIIDEIVKEIKEKKYTYYHGLKYFIPTILSNFDISKVESFVLLFYYCQDLVYSNYKQKVSFCIIDILLKQALLQDDSDLALHLYAFVIKPTRYGSAAADRLIFKDALAELEKVKDRLLLQYQENVEHHKLNEMLAINPFLASIVAEFVPWYYNGDLERTNFLFAAARDIFDQHGVTDREDESILHVLLTEMFNRKHLDTFEAFRVYNELLKRHKNKSYRKLCLVGKVGPCGEVADCIVLLHSPIELQVVNKMHKMPLCVHEGLAECFKTQDFNENKLLASVDPDTALTTFQFQHFGHLDASEPGGVVKVTKNNAITPWMIKPVGHSLVKIYTKDGKVLKFLLTTVVALQLGLNSNTPHTHLIALLNVKPE